ncbi:MAG: thiamine-phosphate kinase [Thermoproteota archaeon]|nr:thiamine-phosphate kinase [Candidatus Brockarchaeota archaeon]MBO3768424.1 thiamine-phosphate kinase [Candidatus Brockarchaeota archaeon]MBO3801381.1 thiamine-phosphate kinase [Candidatus Brockarchaeota archaeon]
MKEITAAKLGEWKIIDLFKKFSVRSHYLEKYDDAWCFKVGKKYFSISCDMLVYSTDVPKTMTWKQVGRKAIIMSASDIASKGHKPAYFLVALGIPRILKEKEIKNLIKGIKEGVQEVGGSLVAGDTNESNETVISVTTIGYSYKPPIRRTLGEEGNIIATVGEFGDSAAGLLIALGKLRSPKGVFPSLIKAVNEPKARIKEGITLGRMGILAGATDSSDGLAISLYNMVKNSDKLGVVIEKLPVSKNVRRFAELNNLNLEDLVLYGGEEYSLVISVKKDKEKLLKEKIDGTRITKIGRVVKGGGVWLKKEGKLVKVKNKGWEHFKT